MATATVTDRFTAVPKTRDMIGVGVPAAAIPTYNALADHANNKTGECWPMMETLARILGRTVKTIQRHLRLLEEAGLVEILERRRDGKGRFLGFRFKLPHLARAAARIKERREKNQAAYELRKKERQEARETHDRRRAAGRPSRSKAANSSSGHSPAGSSGHSQEARRERAQERRRGYEWLFDEAPEKGADVVREQAFVPAPDPSPSPMSAGHQSPLAPLIGKTNSEITLPPNPREGAKGRPSFEEELTTTISPLTGETQTREPPAVEVGTEDEDAVRGAFPGTTSRPPADIAVPTHVPFGNEGAVDNQLQPGNAAWALVAYAAAEIHGDLDVRELSITGSTLEGSTLRVELRDAPIIGWSGLRRREVGRTADRTRSRHGEDLRSLWREISGDPEAVLDLGGGAER